MASVNTNMTRFFDICETLRHRPTYALMRALARFNVVRNAVGGARGLLHRGRLAEHLAACEQRMESSFFPALDRARVVSELRDQGLALGLVLPTELLSALRAHADVAPCYADRDPALGFDFRDHAAAQDRLGKPLLLGQYFNVHQTCPAVRALVDDPAIQWIAGRYLDSIPTFVGANLWWTFPVDATEQDRDRHAHCFHRDVDDFRFLKFFFYLTDVLPSDGAHVCVRASHRSPPVRRRGDQWRLRRYSDEEIRHTYPASAIAEICGSAGQGFAENTLCIHKGYTPTKLPRLLLQLQFALFDHGAMHDHQPAAALRNLV